MATYGFRCAKYPPLSDPLTAAVGSLSREYSKEKPASDETFRLYENIYSYDRTPLNAVTEAVDDTPEHWRTEKVCFDAAYGTERVTAYLFLPRNAVPPYQTVVFFPGGYGFRARSARTCRRSSLISSFAAAMPSCTRSTRVRTSAEEGCPCRGLALCGPGFSNPEIGRSIDYLETRPDIDRERLAYYGISAGALLGPILTALEPRLKASIFLSGGFPPYSLPPEADPINFAPRAKVPVLMVNGRHDFALPQEASEEPMFRLLGAPQKDKRRVVFDDSGHFPNPNRVPEIYKEALIGWTGIGAGSGEVRSGQAAVLARGPGVHQEPDRGQAAEVRKGTTRRRYEAPVAR